MLKKGKKRRKGTERNRRRGERKRGEEEGEEEEKGLRISGRGVLRENGEGEKERGRTWVKGER